ncbi:MAG: nucleotidyltransferase domain-containing protein [Oscillospiraceae bacterium]|jgi:hypothetical protein|nr:nucleotidyltransferase domain-containing protein [Oscillospiraceae bacterium]
MSKVITETRAMEIVEEFLTELRRGGAEDILALYVIGSLGGGYYRPGQSDIDTVILVRNGAGLTQARADEIAARYQKAYRVPKGFGSVLIHPAEMYPPYTKSETDEFEFTVEIARLKTQGKAVFGSVGLDAVPMPSRADFLRDVMIFERWSNRYFGAYPFQKIQFTGCVNSMLIFLRRWLIIEKNIFEFNKFRIIDAYLASDPPITDGQAFDLIRRKLAGETKGTRRDLAILRECGERFRTFFGHALLGVDIHTL